MNKKPISREEYEKMQTQVEKMKYKLNQMKKKNPAEFTEVLKETHVVTDLETKLTALNLVIGYLVRKGIDTKLPVDILIGIADDYEKRLSEE